MDHCSRRDFLKTLGAGAALLTLGGRPFAQPNPAPGAGGPQAWARPNIVFIYTDDMGWGDPSCFGDREIATPNIDRLAAEGIRFTQFYTASPICSPSRVGITTGMCPARWNFTTYQQRRTANRACEQVDWLDLKAPTNARVLKAAGYATGHFGKWHMGGGRDVQDAPWPKAYGFDEHHVNFEGCGPRIETEGIQGPPLVDGKPLPRHEFTRYWVDKSIDFVKRHKAGPFYLELWPMDVHDPHMPDPEKLPEFAGQPEGHRNFDAVLREYDEQIGRLLDMLRAEGLEENTLVVFASDNGPNPSFQHQRSGGLRGQKWSLYEGGIRTPFIVRWKGKIPAGKVDNRTILCGVDLLPTFCALTGATLPPGFDYDGQAMNVAWLGTPVDRARPLFWEYGRNSHPGFIKPKNPQDVSPNVAMREGPWKLLVNADGSGAELYNLIDDPKETKNLVASQPEVAARMKEAALAWRRALPKVKLGAPNAPAVPPGPAGKGKKGQRKKKKVA